MNSLALLLYDLFGTLRSRLWRLVHPSRRPQHWTEGTYWMEVTAFDKDGQPLEQPHQRTFLARLYRLWMQHPDLRFGQMLLNCFRDSDLYDLSNEEMITRIEVFYASKTKEQKSP